MLRIVGGMVFEGKLSEDRFHVTTVDLGHGHFEACVQHAIDWVESAPLDPDSICAQVLRGERDDPNEDEKRQANLRRAARRAKTNVRRRCKAQGLDTLLTLTYKANQLDYDLARLHVKLFLERMRALYRAQETEFAFVGCFEQQKRGAWHVHLATQKLPRMLCARNGVKVNSWNVIRAVWRRVVGELGGNIDVGRKRAQKSAAKCAAYISKYVLKMFEAGEAHAKRFTWSRCEVPKSTRVEFQAASMRDLLSMVVQVAVEQGRSVSTAWLSPFGDVFFVCGETLG
jgi:hypothetical protein